MDYDIRQKALDAALVGRLDGESAEELLKRAQEIVEWLADEKPKVED